MALLMTGGLGSRLVRTGQIPSLWHLLMLSQRACQVPAAVTCRMEVQEWPHVLDRVVQRSQPLHLIQTHRSMGKVPLERQLSTGVTTHSCT